MDIKPYDKTIRDILGSKRQFVIPRFQREYSWDKKNYQEFLEDMVGNLVIKKGKFLPVNIFWAQCYLLEISLKELSKRSRWLMGNSA